MKAPAVDHLHDGFRFRGREVAYPEVFVETSFAFAVTLLAISIDAIPDSVDELLEALKDAPAFGVSLAMLALFSTTHARWRRRCILDAALTTVLSVTFVFFMLL
jgi:hypothetical protein